MNIEVLRIWLENSEELNALLDREGMPITLYEKIKHTGFKKWLIAQIQDGANPIDLYIKCEHYIKNCIPAHSGPPIRDVFWETLNKYIT